MTFECSKLSVAPAKHRPILVEELSLTCPEGSITALIGPNGAGKTTLLRAMAGLCPSEQGRITLDQKPLQEWSQRERAKRIAFMAQRVDLQVELHVREVVELGRLPYRHNFTAPSAKDREAIAQAMRLTQVEELADRPLATLSGGEMQRVLLARLLATEATHLFLDEPTTAMDIGHSLDFMEFIRELARSGKTIVVSLHDLELARRYADITLCLGIRQPPHWIAGPTSQIMTPAQIESVFGVTVRVHEGGLSFDPGKHHFAKPAGERAFGTRRT
jgi:iron complex transport system ATP-binding protein